MYNIVLGFCIFGIVTSSTTRVLSESAPSALTLALRGASPLSPSKRMSPEMTRELIEYYVDPNNRIFRTVPASPGSSPVSRGTPPIPISNRGSRSSTVFSSQGSVGTYSGDFYSALTSEALDRLRADSLVKVGSPGSGKPFGAILEEVMAKLAVVEHIPEDDWILGDVPQAEDKETDEDVEEDLNNQDLYTEDDGDVFSRFNGFDDI